MYFNSQRSLTGIYLLIASLYIGFGFVLIIFNSQLKPLYIVLMFLLGGQITVKNTPFKYSFIFLIAIYIFSTLLNYNKFYFIKGLTGCFSLILCYLTYYFTTALLLANPKVNIEKAINFLIEAGFIYMCLIVLGVVLNFIGIQNNFGAANWQVALTKDQSYADEISLFGYHTLTAGFLACVGVMLVGRMLLLKRKSNNLYEIFKVLIFIIALISSYSRGAWLCFMAGSVILGILYIKTHKIRLTFFRLLIPIFVAIYFIYQFVVDNSEILLALTHQFGILISAENGTGYERILLWSKMIDDISKNPFIGGGGGAFLQYIPYSQGDSENFFLEIFHSTGIFGFLAIVVPIVVLIVKSTRYIRRKSAILNDPILAIVFVSAIALLIPMLTTPGGWSGFFWFMFGLWTSVVVYHERRFKSRKETISNNLTI